MILLSIHPGYVEKIVSGEKTFEFRKSLPSEFDNDRRVAVYSTSPVCKVVAVLEVGSVLHGAPSILWGRVSRGAGISRAEFDAYYNGRSIAFAYKIDKVNVLKRPVTLRSIGWTSGAPQSFCYLNARICVRLDLLMMMK